MPDRERAVILRRIRAANDAETSLFAAEQSWRRIPREYRRGATLAREQIIELFIDRLHDYDAAVVRVSASEVVAAVATIIATNQSGAPGRILLAAGFPQGWVPQNLECTYDNQFSPSELDLFGGVLTTATLGIAETGTLVLQNVPGQGRRAATLVPDIHICVVQAADVVQSVPEAIDRLAPTACLPTTFVSGPSATADIEMTRIKGVHGPRFLQVVLID